MFCRFVLLLNLLLKICDSLLHVFRGLFVLLFQFLELLLETTVLLGRRQCWQKHHSCAYRNPFGLESATHALIIRSPRTARYGRVSLIVDCNHLAVSPIASVSSSCAWAYSSWDCNNVVWAASSCAEAASACERR